MMKKILLLVACCASVNARVSKEDTHSALIKKYSDVVPAQWGERVTGVKTRLATQEKVIALTLDLCGSATDGLDERYLTFFEAEKISATIFVSNEWIERHPDMLQKIVNNPLYDIQNHGLHHKPCSVNGKKIYGAQGTKNVAEVIEEIENNALIIKKHTGKKPVFYRAGMAYYDEIAVKIAGDLGFQVVGFDILGDAGASWSKEKVKASVLKAQPGSIIILHLNRPKKESAEGAIEALKELLKNGFKCVKLADYSLK